MPIGDWRSIGEILEGVAPQILGDAYSAVSGRAKRISGLPTGHDDLDRALGGMLPGALIALGGPSGSGKSALALHITRKVADHGAVVFFSGDAPRAQVITRLLALELHVDSRLLSSPLDAYRQTDTHTRDAFSRITINDNHDLEVAEAIPICHEVNSRAPLELVVLDCPAMVEQKRSTDEENETNVLMLKKLARDLHIAVLMVTSPVVGGTRLGQTLASVPGSVAHHADVVLLLRRLETEFTEDQWADTHPNQEYPRGLVFATIPKNRQGVLDTAVLAFEPKTGRFS